MLTTIDCVTCRDDTIGALDVSTGDHLPAPSKIEPGDTFRLLDLDGILVLTPMAPMAPELARGIERVRLEAGLSIEELLAGLREQRERYYVEH